MRNEDLVNFFQRAIKPTKDRLFMLAGRALLMAINDDEKIQQVQLQALAGESLDKVQRFQEFGFTSVPPVGTEAVILSLGGSRNNSIVIATENRNVRMKNLQSGETAIYTDDGTYIVLKKAGQVEVKAATLLTVDVPNTLIKGNVTIEEKLVVEGQTELENTLLVKENVTMEKDLAITLNQTIGGNLAVTGVIGAAGFTGPGGGPAVLTVDLQTSGEITAANVTAGGTDMASIKSTFNAHTHQETGSTTDPTGTPL